jgi:hypothetical protein
MSENIIEKEGRKAYDANRPRLARSDYTDRQPEPGYVSWQSKINTGPRGTINQKILDKYLEEHGYDRLEPDQIEGLAAGSRIAYVTTDNKWRSGGFLIRTEWSEEDINGNPFDEPRLFVLYKSFNNAVFPVQVEDVEMFYTRYGRLNVIIKKIITFKKPQRITNFPVYLKDEDGYDVAVYYAKDNHQRETFKSREKYKKALNDPEGWSFDDGSQENDLE